MDTTINDLEASGAELIAADERTFTTMEDCLKRIHAARSAPSDSCDRIMAELEAKQKEMKKPWWRRIFGRWL